jgi:hypothetical protein
METLVNGKEPLREAVMRVTHENFSVDYKDVLNEAEDLRVSEGKIEGLPDGPKKVIAACMFFNISPDAIAKARIPRSRRQIYRWIQRYIDENRN